LTAGRYPAGGSADSDKNVALFNVLKRLRADGIPKANVENALAKVRPGCCGARYDHETTSPSRLAVEKTKVTSP
jgi:transcriptional/translational regulatory protein YebC/TACO1